MCCIVSYRGSSDNSDGRVQCNALCGLEGEEVIQYVVVYCIAWHGMEKDLYLAESTEVHSTLWAQADYSLRPELLIHPKWS